MIDRQDIHTKLCAVPSQSISRSSPIVTTIQGTSGTLTMSIVALDRLAATFSSLVYETNTDRRIPQTRLQDVGTQLSQRLQYLMEPIAPIELDGEAAVLQLRSIPPSDEGEKTRSYYEVLVRTNQISIRRFSATTGQVRVESEINLTHEICGRLGSDLAAAHDDVCS